MSSNNEKRKQLSVAMTARRNSIKAIEAYCDSAFKRRQKVVSIQPETLGEFTNIANDHNDLLDEIAKIDGTVEINIVVTSETGEKDHEACKRIKYAMDKLLFTSSADRKPKREPPKPKEPVNHGPN